MPVEPRLLADWFELVHQYYSFMRWIASFFYECF